MKALVAHPQFPGVTGPVLTVVMDGVGIGAGDEGDAVRLARTPTLDWLAANALSTSLRAHGTAVGLPSDEDMGNSEVGHNALGAGRVVDQGAKRVKVAIEGGELFRGAAWQDTLTRLRASDGVMHLIGLLSDGNVHSHIDHLFAMLRQAAEDGLTKVRVHILLDGRDVSETSALSYVEPLEALLAELSAGGQRDFCIASGGGRMEITMDRYEADWPMVERGYRTHVHGDGRHFTSARVAIQTLRDEQPGVTDQHLPAFVIAGEGGTPVGSVRDGDAVLLFNFRGDRAIELCRAFEDDTFPYFDRGRRPDVHFVGMMQYDGDLLIPQRYLVEPPAIDATVGELLAQQGISQLACSETQKFGHVTYFWNGNRSGAFDDATEHYVEIPGDADRFEERPWMKAAELTDRVLADLPRVRSARINYPNGDMVGHTGSRDAAVLAVEAVDLCVGRLLRTIEALKGALIVTADHGNADEMFEKDKVGAFLEGAGGRRKAKTSHTLNPVPCYIHVPERRLALASLSAPGLANVAATGLALLGFERPEHFEPSLLQFND